MVLPTTSPAGINPDAAVLLAQLDEDQVASLLDNIASATEEKRQEYFADDPSEYTEERVKRVEKLMKTWMGSITPEQQELIQLWSQQLMDPKDYWLDYRLAWNRTFARTLQQRTADDFEQQLARLLIDYRGLWSDQYLAAVDHNTNLGIDLFMAIQRTATPRQRQHLDKELAKWIATFEQIHLAATGNKTMPTQLSDASDTLYD